ncbi:MAG: 4Fe-4S binding protein [Spirochaetales bacterium]|jgi:NAD-dependent dihydropyrimidine dehydrogenase PreA subunit|nr:4Fe-4S binding protein [Spirochaetales bacterium]
MAYVISAECIACGSCISECPVEAIAEGDIYSIDPDKCIDCGSCASVCPNDAISAK